MMKTRAWLLAVLTVIGAPIASADATETPSGVIDAETTFHVGDAIDLSVVGYEDELNGIYRVGADGTIEIPYIGSIDAAGLTADQATSRITETIWRYYINQPQVIVKPLYTVTVLGSVYRPGPYHIEGGERLSTLLGMAGGERPEGQIKKARVTRDGEVLSRNLKEALEEGRTVNDIGIHSGDVIYVPKSSWWGDWRNWAVIISSVSLSVAVYDRITR